MADGLLGLVLDRLGEDDFPVIRHREVEAFLRNPASARYRRLLLDIGPAEEVPRPAGVAPGDWLLVRETSAGLFGVGPADDLDAPVPLADEDVREYTVSIPRLGREITEANDMDPDTSAHLDDGLFPLGSKAVGHGLRADVHLFVPYDSRGLIETAANLALSRTGGQGIVLLVPRTVPLSPEARASLRARGVEVVPLLRDGTASLDVDWGEIRRRFLETVPRSDWARPVVLEVRPFDGPHDPRYQARLVGSGRFSGVDYPRLARAQLFWLELLCTGGETREIDGSKYLAVSRTKAVKRLRKWPTERRPHPADDGPPNLEHDLVKRWDNFKRIMTRQVGLPEEIFAAYGKWFVLHVRPNEVSYRLDRRPASRAK